LDNTLLAVLAFLALGYFLYNWVYSSCDEEAVLYGAEIVLGFIIGGRGNGGDGILDGLVRSDPEGSPQLFGIIHPKSSGSRSNNAF
jgi:hypothetical protein